MAQVDGSRRPRRAGRGRGRGNRQPSAVTMIIPGPPAAPRRQRGVVDDEGESLIGKSACGRVGTIPGCGDRARPARGCERRTIRPSGCNPRRARVGDDGEADRRHAAPSAHRRKPTALNGSLRRMRRPAWLWMSMVDIVGEQGGHRRRTAAGTRLRRRATARARQGQRPRPLPPMKPAPRDALRRGIRLAAGDQPCLAQAGRHSRRDRRAAGRKRPAQADGTALAARIGCAAKHFEPSAAAAAGRPADAAGHLGNEEEIGI